MSDLTGKFAALEEQLADEAAAEALALAAINTRLDEFSVTLDTMSANAAANTKYLLNALSQLDPCQDCGAGSILVPPVTVGVTPVNSDRCKRAQAFLATIAAFCSGYDTLVSYNVVATVGIINKTVTEVIAGIGAGDTVPLPSIPETINILGNYFSYASANIFGTTSMSDALSAVYGSLLPAIYIAGSAEASQAAYNAVIDGSELPFPAANLLKATAYNALWSYFFDPESTPDLSGYDGSVCGGALADITSCTDFEAVLSTFEGTTWYRILVPVLGGGDDLGIEGDYFGWSLNVVAGDPLKGVDFGYKDGSLDYHLLFQQTLGAEPVVVDHHTAWLYINSTDTNEDAEVYTVRICPPE